MDRDKFKKIEEIYHAALDVGPERREGFVQSECDGDPELEKEVEALLKLEAGPAGFLETSPADVAAMMFSEREEADNFVDKTIGRYRVQRLLGEGGMGTVFLAYDPRLARSVALKVLPAEMVSNDDRVQRFMHEARAASALNHPHILTVYEIDEVADDSGRKVHFISMEYVDGKTLDQLIYKEKTPAGQLLTYLTQVANGLAKAHSAGIIHRDLKPENIIVSTDGYAKILDFGLAKLAGTEHELGELQQHKSRPGVILGTLGYMSPEQALGKPDIDERSDVFSFGCILYEVITRRKAFHAETTIDALHQIIHSEPISIKSIDPDIPDKLISIVEKCLAKEPDQRFSDAGQIASLIETVSGDGLVDQTAVWQPKEQPTLSIDGATTGKRISRTASGQRRHVTVMLIDASAISEMIEDLDPEKSSVIMNEVWDFLREIILRGGGRIGERLADSVLAVWGTDATRESDPERSVRTALDLQVQLAEYFERKLSKEVSFTAAQPENLDQDRFLKIAISTGTVLVGTSRSTGEFVTAGSAVNIAKRLIAKTSMGDVIASHDTYRHIRGIFQVEQVGSKSERSIRQGEPRTDLYLIRGAKPRVFRTETRGVEGVDTPMVGREPELLKILTALEAVKEDRELQILTVVGEAGLGKSRLLFEFYDKVDLLPERSFVFKARALETMQGQPYSLLKDIFLFRFDIKETDSQTTTHKKFVDGIVDLTADTSGAFGDGRDLEMKAHFIGQLIGFDFSSSPHISGLVGSEKQIQDRAILYTWQFFSSVAERHPAVFYLDDLHWADDESLDFLDTISIECSNSAILICGFARMSLFERRPHWGEGRENWRRIQLLPLTKRETGKLISDLLEKADGIPLPLQEMLVTKTAGNPFYVEELIKMFIEQGVIDTRGDRWVIEAASVEKATVPQTLTGVLQSRLDRLSEIERRVLQRASVVGREFWDTTLDELQEGIDIPSVLEALRQKELIFRKEISALDESAEYVFKHALLRDVTYETILLEERQTWHLQTAEFLVRTKGERRNEYLAVIADHFEKGGDVERSADWFGRAADAARRTYALQVAENYYVKALDAWNAVSNSKASAYLTTEQVLQWRNGLGQVIDLQARHPEAIAAFTEMLEIAKLEKSKIGQAYAFLGLSVSQFEMGQTGRSLESAIETARLAGNDDLVSSKDANFLLASGYYRQGRALVSLGKFEEAISLTQSYAKLLSERGVDTPTTRVNILHILAGANMYLGRFREAQEFETKEVDISREVGDLLTLSNGLNSLGFQQYLRGNPTEAINYYEEALQIARDVGNKTGQIMIQSNIYGARVLLGEYDFCEVHLKSLISEVGDKGHFLVSEMYRFLAEALVGQGKHEEALEKAKRSLVLSEETDNQDAIGEAWRILGVAASCIGAKVQVEDGEFSASACFQKSLDITEKLGMEANHALTLHHFARYRQAKGDLKGASELLDRETEISKRLEIDTAAKGIYFHGKGSDGKAKKLSNEPSSPAK